MMKAWLGSRAWLLSLVFLFFIGNLIFWTYNSHEGCDENGNCPPQGPQHNFVDEEEGGMPPPPPPPHQQPPPPAPVVPQQPPPPPPPPKEAALGGVLVLNSQPLHQPDTYKPKQHPASSKDLDMVAPTADQITMHLSGNSLKYAQGLEAWQFGVINSKPDVFIASDGHLADVINHYNREHRIYTLMKWILRVHRRDPTRKNPLLMVDAGSNHGLFSMVATVSGAHTIAFEPQTHLRSVIGLGGRLNQVSRRLRVLPFAVLDKYRKLSMSNFEINDGGIGSLDYNVKDSIMQTQTIPLDSLPSFNSLFGDETNEKTLINTPQEISPQYAAGLEACNSGKTTKMNDALLLRQPIHFLKIDVEGFELQALDSATALFEAGLVEHAVLEFGPPSRWDITIENMDPVNEQAKIRQLTIEHSKKILHRVVKEWDMDIYLLPANGWEKTVEWMMERNVNFNENKPTGNKVVHQLKSWDFDGKPQDKDEFERELEGKGQLVSEVIPLPENLIDGYMDDMQEIGEMYLWFVKRTGNPNILKKLEI